MEALTGRELNELMGDVTDLSKWDTPLIFEIATVPDIMELLMYDLIYPNHISHINI